MARDPVLGVPDLVVRDLGVLNFDGALSGKSFLLGTNT